MKSKKLEQKFVAVKRPQRKRRPPEVRRLHPLDVDEHARVLLRWAHGDAYVNVFDARHHSRYDDENR